MRGSYLMREWEIPHLTKIVKDALRQVEGNMGSKFDFTRMDICPYDISTILTEFLGFEEEDLDANFKDFWYVFTHPKYSENARLFIHVNIDTLECKMFYEEE